MIRFSKLLFQLKFLIVIHFAETGLLAFTSQTGFFPHGFRPVESKNSDSRKKRDLSGEGERRGEGGGETGTLSDTEIGLGVCSLKVGERGPRNVNSCQ